jgi:hypothetical protein
MRAMGRPYGAGSFLRVRPLSIPCGAAPDSRPCDRTSARTSDGLTMMRKIGRPFNWAGSFLRVRTLSPSCGFVEKSGPQNPIP